jgi:hypothetical protein
MLFHTSLLGFVAYFILLLQPAKEVELIPVDAGVEDRGALSGSLRVEPVDWRQNNDFEKLYRIAGSDGIFVRKAGGLRAVFRNPSYFDTRSGAIPIIPAGTVYSIGEINAELYGQLKELSDIAAPDELVIAQRYGFYEESVPITTRPSKRGSVRFIDDEQYRREKLTFFVINIVLGEQTAN